MKKIIVVILLLVAFIFIKGQLFPGVSNISNDPLVGKKVIIGLPLVYASDALVSGERDIVTQINHRLVCPSQYSNLRAGYLYKDGVPHLIYVPATTEFTVEKVFDLKNPYDDFSKIVVLKDKSGIESTAYAKSINTPGHFCLNEDIEEIPQNVRDIFKTIDKNGTASVEILLSESSPSGGSRAYNKTSKESTRTNFLAALPARYQFSNIIPIERTISEDGVDYLRYGVKMNVNGEALALLLMQQITLNVESIKN